MTADLSLIGAFFVGVGVLTRLAAASLGVGMIGALYTSVCLREDWLSRALFHHLRLLELHWPWQILNRSSAANQKDKSDYMSYFRF